MVSYKPHEARFACRKTFKRRLLQDVNPDESEPESTPAKCPECGQLTADMGLDFKSPPRTDLKAWERLRTLYRAGITFHSCECSGPSYVPTSNTELRAFLLNRKQHFVRSLRATLTDRQAVVHWNNRIQEVDQHLTSLPGID